MSRHDSFKGVDNVINFFQAAILSEDLQEVRRWGAERDFGSDRFESLGLQSALDDGVFDELAQLGVGFHGALEFHEFPFDGLQLLFLGGRRVKGGRVAAFDAEDLDWRFDHLLHDVARAHRPYLNKHIFIVNARCTGVILLLYY